MEQKEGRYGLPNPHIYVVIVLQLNDFWTTCTQERRKTNILLMLEGVQVLVLHSVPISLQKHTKPAVQIGF